ncbi:MAG: S26 family signal peptidase [Patescibacteria group bacterium]
MKILYPILFLIIAFLSWFLIESLSTYIFFNIGRKTEKINYITALKLTIALFLFISFITILYFITLLIFHANWKNIKSFNDIATIIYYNNAVSGGVSIISLLIVGLLILGLAILNYYLLKKYHSSFFLKRGRTLIAEIIFFIVVFSALAAGRGFFIKSYKRGDIALIHNPENQQQYLLKRIVGLPYEKVQIQNGKVFLFNKDNPQGFILDEPYLPKKIIDSDIIQLSGNEYFLITDNKDNSTENSYIIRNKESIIGKY